MTEETQEDKKIAWEMLCAALDLNKTAKMSDVAMAVEELAVESRDLAKAAESAEAELEEAKQDLERMQTAVRKLACKFQDQAEELADLTY